MSKNIGFLTVVLPTYNEEIAVGNVLQKIHEYLKGVADNFEVVVVNDGSVDRTREVVLEAKGKGCSEIRLIEHKSNKGYGEALRSGFNAAIGDWILLMDADGQFDIGELESFLPYVKSYDVIIGYRQQRADSWWRVLMTWGYTFLIKLLFNLQVKDVGCAFKLFKRDTWVAAQPIKSVDHKIFSVEWLCKLQERGFKIKQLPVAHYPRMGGMATGARWDVVLAMLGEMVRLRVRGW